MQSHANVLEMPSTFYVKLDFIMEVNTMRPDQTADFGPYY